MSKNNPILENVLILEDDPYQRNAIKKAFDKYGLKIITTKSINKAVELAKKQNVTNFILDINLGKSQPMGGLNALEI